MEFEDKKRPLVSVILATFNRPDTLVEALESILAQTYRNFEIIVVNDGGQDVSNVIQKLNISENILYLQHKINKGPSAARNTGIRAAKGEYIAYLDDDDIYYRDHLEAIVEFLEARNYKFAYSDCCRITLINKNGKMVEKGRERWSFDIDPNQILVGNFIHLSTVVHARICIEEVGFFDESLWLGEDWDLWIRISRKYEIGHLKKVTTEYRWKINQGSLSSGKLAERPVAFEKIYLKHRALAESNPKLLRMQQKALEQERKRINPDDWARRERLKLILAKFIGVKGVNFLYRLKLKMKIW